MSDVESPQDVYARLLVRVEPPRGYPLWVPEPNNNLPEEYRCEGMRIGDVGVVREDGSFDVFFNICLPENHSLHEDYGVPPGFKQIAFSRRNHSHHPSFDSPGRVIATKSIAQSRIDAGLSASSTTMLQAGAGLGFQFTSNSVEGALLVLPEGSEAHDVLSLSDFEAEAQENASRWYAFARQNLRRVISDDSIYLITGFHKTSSWSLGSFRQAGGNSAFTAQLTAGKVIDGNIAAAYSWEITDSMASRVGPLVGYSGGKNQTVFVRGYKIAIKGSGPLRRLLGKEGPQVKVSPVPSIRPSFKGFMTGSTENSSRNPKTTTQGSRSLPAPHDSSADMGDSEDDGDPEVSVERVPPALKIYHPSDVINHFLLQNTPDARVAITHDSQWADAFTENECITDSEIIDYIRGHFDPVFDEVKGVVSLQRKDPHQKATGTDPPESLTAHAGSSSQIDSAVGDSNESTIIGAMSSTEFRWKTLDRLAQKAKEESNLATWRWEHEFAAAIIATDETAWSTEKIRKAQAEKWKAEEKPKTAIQPVVIPSAQVAEAKRRIQYKEGAFHFAIAGVTGSGKSSLINAFRGLKNKDAGAAATDVTETTLTVARYSDVHPQRPFVWYEIPGGGTLNTDDWQYFLSQGLYVFDSVIVLFDNRFTMTDIAILTSCRRLDIPTYIVRSKADRHIRNIMRDIRYDGDDEPVEPEYHNMLYEAAPRHFIQETRNNVKAKLEELDMPDQRVYIISSDTMLNIVQEKNPKEIIDEPVLLMDLFSGAQVRRSSRQSGRTGQTP